MAELLRAEWQKIVGHRWLTGLMLWIFPVGMFAFMGAALLLALLSPGVRAGLAQSDALWTEALLSIWTFPGSILGRLFLLGFVTVVFAGEYQWGTWKYLIPRRRRGALLLAKFIVVFFLILLVFTLTSLIRGVGEGILSLVVGRNYGPPLSAEVVGQFAREYAARVGMALLSLFIASGYAATAAIFMRSIVGGLVTGLAVTLVEPAVIALGFLASIRLESAFFLRLVRLLPFYNLDNLESLLFTGQPSSLNPPAHLFPGLIPAHTAADSALILAAWSALLLGLIFWWFRRQDLGG